VKRELKVAGGLPSFIPYERSWHEIDATGKVVGRLANEVSKLLQGKHKPLLKMGADLGDYVVITNADKALFTGVKWDTKKYVRHTGWPGGLKHTPVAVWKANYPDRIITHAVKGMLPKNQLRYIRMDRLKLVMSGQSNPHTRLVEQTPPQEHLTKAIEKTKYKEPLFDPNVHAGYYLEKEQQIDGTFDLATKKTPGTKKYRFYRRIREPKLETAFKDRIVRKRGPLPTIFDMLPENVQQQLLNKK